MEPLQVWLRFGDQDGYHNFDDIQEATDEIWHRGIREIDRWIQPGFETGSLSGNNYVSMYWGNKSATRVHFLTDAEQRQVVESLAKGIE